MKFFFKHIFDIGITENIPKTEEKKIRMLNAACAFWILFAIFLIVKFILFDAYPLEISLFHCFTILILILIIFIQKKMLFFTARILFLVLLYTNLFLIANYFKTSVLVEYFYILVPLFTVYFTNNQKIQYGSLALSILLFYIPPKYWNHYPEFVFGSGSFLGVFLAPFIMIKYLMNLNTSNEKYLEIQKNTALTDKNIIDEQRRELEELNRFQSQFFINISHEIRTPLTLILGKADVLKEHDVAKYNRELSKTIDQIGTQSNKIRQIVDDVIDLAKMNSNQVKLNTKKVEISEFLNKLYISFDSLFKQHHVLFEYNSSLQAEIDVDTVYLERALNNIISNALKYTPKGGAFIVTLQKESDDTISISFQDSGIGISKKEIEKIFDRFYQADNDINKSQGSGVGLAFTKEVIELLNGDISVKSKLGEGTNFKIVLPALSIVENIGIEINNKINTAVIDSTLDTRITSSSIKEILVVDDNKEMREYLISLLNEYLCYEADNGQEALDFLNGRRVDMIITDYMMPVMDGYVLTQRIKELSIDTPIIMLTARADQEGKINALRLGLDDYLTKPFNKEELKVKVANSIRNFKEKEKFMIQEKISEIDLKYTSFIQEMEKFILMHCAENSFGVEDIVSEFSISKSSLYRKIKTTTGLSPLDFINEVKLKKARSTITSNPSISLKELSYSVGFKQPSYFSKLYEKRFGIKPIS